MFRKMIAGAAALVSGVVAACDNVPTSSVLFMRPGGVRVFLSSATRSGPLLVETVNSPFGGTLPALSVLVAENVAGGVLGRSVTATTDASQATDPKYRVRVAFDMPAGRAPDSLCQGEAFTPAPNPDRLRVMAVFCNGSTADAVVGGSLKRPVDIGDPRLPRLFRQISRQMFDDTSDVDRR